jgi:hypothetical protein
LRSEARAKPPLRGDRGPLVIGGIGRKERLRVTDCDCSAYGHLGLDRKSISVRIPKSKQILRTLDHVADHEDREHRLFRCSHCGQFWQSARAWNWGNDPYVFQVPNLSTDEWCAEPFVDPDALMVFDAVMRGYFARTEFTPGEQTCRDSQCNKAAAKGLAHCKDHHVRMLQNAGSLPKCPSGRMFHPYEVKSEGSA